MVAFAQWELRMRLGVLPILIGWLVICIIYGWKESRRRRQRLGKADTEGKRG